MPAYLCPYTAHVLLMMGGIVTRNMLSKAFAKNKPQLLHLVGIIFTTVRCYFTTKYKSTKITLRY
jgi:hypothetical protein